MTRHDETAEASESAFQDWRTRLLELTSSEDLSQSWRHRRYRFAHRLGQELVGSTTTSPGLVGPAVYGVWLRWGLLYVGQTLEAERRLRDLAIGESHHLANTFPPEIWHRVVVIAWPRLPPAPQLMDAYSANIIGLALEHQLQLWLKPLANSSRRTMDGSFRNVDWSASRSLGAQSASQIEELFAAVRSIWPLADTPVVENLFGPDVIRTVRPQTLL